MEKIFSNVWYVVIAVILLIVAWSIGRNSKGKTNRNTIEPKQAATATQTVKTDTPKESERIAVKRDFNDVDSLIKEVNEVQQPPK